jgi:hypothetical protein
MLYLDLPSTIEATGFTPQDLVEIRVSSVTAEVYSKILPTMAVFECVHIFQVNKTALTNLQANLRLVFDAFGRQLNATSIVDSIYSDCKRHFNEHWHAVNNLTILSFHNSAGSQINNTTLPGNPQVLLHIQDKNLANCCSQDVCFVHVKCTLNFTSRQHMVCNPTPPILCVSYYFELPQSTCALTSGNGQAYTLVAYAGPEDFRNLSHANVQLQILAACMQDSPILLKASNFNLPSAKMMHIRLASSLNARSNSLLGQKSVLLSFMNFAPAPAISTSPMLHLSIFARPTRIVMVPLSTPLSLCTTRGL